MCCTMKPVKQKIHGNKCYKPSPWRVPRQVEKTEMIININVNYYSTEICSHHPTTGRKLFRIIIYFCIKILNNFTQSSIKIIKQHACSVLILKIKLNYRRSPPRNAVLPHYTYAGFPVKASVHFPRLFQVTMTFSNCFHDYF